MKNKAVEIYIYRSLFIIWSLIILTLTSIPKLSTPVDHILNIDKLAHLGVYSVFAYLFIKMNRRQKPAKTMRTLIYLAVLIPLFDELHQIPIPGRTFSVWDLLADWLGFFIIILLFKFRKIQNPKNL